MVITQTKQNHTSFKIHRRRVILAQHCQESGSSNQHLAPRWSSSASKPKLESGRKLQCILQAWQHPLQHSEDFNFFMWVPTRPRDKETITIYIHGIHCISNHYKEENCYCAGFIVGCFSGHSRKGEERQGKQSSSYGDWETCIYSGASNEGNYISQQQAISLHVKLPTGAGARYSPCSIAYFLPAHSAA